MPFLKSHFKNHTPSSGKNRNRDQGMVARGQGRGEAGEKGEGNTVNNIVISVHGSRWLLAFVG